MPAPFDGEEYKATENGSRQLETQSAHTGYSSSNQKYSTAREVSETVSSKLYETVPILFTIAVNAGLFAFLYILGQGAEMTLAIPNEIVGPLFSVMALILVLIANLLTSNALDSGFAALFGYLLTSTHGYSLAACGFRQTGPLSKLSFCGNLSLSSVCRKPLTRISFLWMIVVLLRP